MTFDYLRSGANRMDVKPKRKSVTQNGDDGEDLVVASMINNGEDLGPVLRHAFEMGRPEGLLYQLKTVVKKKEVEIEEICKSHYLEFILAVDELRGVLVDAEELKSELSSYNYRLQEVGSVLLARVEELLEYCSVKKNVVQAVIMLKICIQVLELCLKCNNYMVERQFYLALKMVDAIERNYLQNVPVKTLKMAIEKTLPVIKSHIEKRVTDQFTEWLVHIRGSAKDIGQVAIGHTASVRQRREEMLERQRKAEEGNVSGLSDFAFILDVEEISEDSFVKFDLTPLYRAFHIHVCLGIQEQFLEYYYKNRLLQLNSDLQILSSQSFIESYQSYFAQVVGYFIVEDRVMRTAGSLLGSNQVETMWETAISKITSVLDEQFSYMDSANHLLLVKDYVTLLAETLRQYGYGMGQIFEALDNGRERYHELILRECREQIVGVLRNDTYEQMVIKNDTEYENNVLAFNLQTSDIIPAFPFIAPFSIMVPDTCRIVRSFIKGSTDYLSYGVHNNVYDVVRKYLDTLLIDVLNEVILGTIQNGAVSVSQAMQIAANISVLEGACDFFILHAAQLCGIPTQSVHRHEVTAKTVLQKSRNTAYLTFLNLVNTKLDIFMSLTENVNWVPDEASENGNECINEALIYLDTILSTAQQILPLDALYKVGSGALEHISDSIVAAFLSDSVKRFNANAVATLNHDLKALESFADERFEGTGLSEIYKEGSFRGSLIKARQLINLLSSSTPENFMNPVIREKNYNVLDYKKVASICDKFKDSPDGIFGSLSNRSTKQSGRKKSMDVLKKRLKDFN